MTIIIQSNASGQEGQDITNRDEEAFLLSHVYNNLLLSAATTVAIPSRESSVK